MFKAQNCYQRPFSRWYRPHCECFLHWPIHLLNLHSLILNHILLLFNSQQPLSSNSSLVLSHNFLFCIKTLCLSLIKTGDYILGLPGNGGSSVTSSSLVTSTKLPLSWVVTFKEPSNLHVDILELIIQPNMPYCMLSMQNHFKYSHIGRLKVKTCKKLCYANTKERKKDVGTSDETQFIARKVTRDRVWHCIMIKSKAIKMACNPYTAQYQVGCHFQVPIKWKIHQDVACSWWQKTNQQT